MWTRLSDDFFAHPKVVRAGRDARDLYLVALTHCNRHLTDGFVGVEYLRRLTAEAEIDDGAACAGRLVEVGLWEPGDGGWMVHDFLDYNPNRAEVEAKRAKTAARVGDWRKRRKAGSNAVTHPGTSPVTNGGSTPSPGPGPSLFTSKKTDPLPPSDEAKPAAKGRRRSSSEDAEEVEAILATSPVYWRSALEKETAAKDPKAIKTTVEKWQLGTLQNWQKGDGTPEAPPPPPRPVTIAQPEEIVVYEGEYGYEASDELLRSMNAADPDVPIRRVKAATR